MRLNRRLASVPFRRSKKVSWVRLVTAAHFLAAGAALAQPLTYSIDESHTYPRFSYSHYGLSTQLSSFSRTTGTIEYDAIAKTARVDITIDTTSVNTGSGVFDSRIQGEDYLDTQRFPIATFKSTNVQFEGDQPRSIDGILTVKGISKPVTLTVTSFATMQHPMVKKPAIGANAYTTFKRSDFNAGRFPSKVGDELRIDIAVEAIAR